MEVVFAEVKALSEVLRVVMEKVISHGGSYVSKVLHNL